MSSRALRKLQKQNEEQQRLADLQATTESESESEPSQQQNKVKNAFDMLGDAGGEEREEGEAELTDPDEQENEEVDARSETNPDVNSAKKKKKRKQKKRKTQATVDQEDASPDKAGKAKLDEIDLALQALSVEGRQDLSDIAIASSEPNYEESLCRLLAVESKHLSAMNEMRRLFGNVALEDLDEVATPARPQNGAVIHLDLASALTAKYSPVSKGQGLVGFALRRNVFIHGKEVWPRATSGGLDMSSLTKRERDGQTFYMFEHNNTYRDTQRQFETCVASMDPQRMVQLLAYNPYHVSTLLQVSEIAKQQGDHSVSGDLLERALFTFGRSVHSSFSNNLNKGLARLLFSEFENREFWLAAWRYIDNLGQRGTFRTAYEWTKLLFALDPVNDPYAILLIIDSIALRGGQATELLSLIRALREAYLESSWPKDRPGETKGNTVEDLVCVDFAKSINRPNLAISAVLARLKIGRERTACAQLLKLCIRTWPFIFFRLFQDLSIEPMPKSIWGKIADSDRDRLSTETYTQYAKDLWNTSDYLKLLKEAANSIQNEDVDGSGHSDEPISLNEARHLLLSSKPALMGIVPRRISQGATSASDPLPPLDAAKYWDEVSDDSSVISVVEGSPQGRHDVASRIALPPDDPTPEAGDEQQELEGLQSWFSRFWRGAPNSSPPEHDAELVRAAAEGGVPEEAILSRQARLVQLAQRLLGTGGAEEATRADHAVAAAREDEQIRQALIRELGIRDEQDAQIHAAQAQAIAPIQDGPPEDDAESEAAPSSSDSDPQRTKRYLAGAGMLALKDFIEKHGGDQVGWMDEGEQVFSEGWELLSTYAEKVLTLSARDRKFIIDYPLAQGAGKDARKLVLEAIDEI